MPSLFSKSKPSTIASISRPTPCAPPTIEDFRGEVPYMQVQRAPPPPPPPPPIPASTPGAPRRHRDTSATQIIELYDRTDNKSFRQPRFHENLSSSSSTYSLSEDEDDMSVSSPASSLSFRREVTQSQGGRSQAIHPHELTRRRYQQQGGFAPQTSQGRTQYQPNRAPPPPPSPAPAGVQQKPHDNALIRGLSQTYGHASRGPPLSRAAAVSTTMTQYIASLPANAQHATVRTRSDTRCQGRWLRNGTMRVPAKELQRQEREFKKVRDEKAKQVRKWEKEMARQAMVAARAGK